MPSATPPAYARHVRSGLTAADEAELEIVDDLARKLQEHIGLYADEIARIHVHGAKSGVVQTHFSRLLKDRLRFEEEVVLTPQDGLVTRARPDFIFRLPSGQGIIAEVERGGTTTNNHDLKDLWKAHVAPDAQHLFLMVPNRNFKADGRSREKPFPIVARRLGAFFGTERREIDVLSVHVFGY